MNKWIKLAVCGLCAIQIVACANQNNNSDIAAGEISQEELLTSYSSFMSPHHKVNLSEQEIGLIKSWPNDVKIDVYFGTWCHDSQREVPKLLTALAYNPAIDIKLIALDYEKNDPGGLAHASGVKFTPTIIIFKDEKEVGRIVERPKQSLVQDINQFVQS